MHSNRLLPLLLAANARRPELFLPNMTDEENPEMDKKAEPFPVHHYDIVDNELEE